MTIVSKTAHYKGQLAPDEELKVGRRPSELGDFV
jgi:hypothetical protein